jgi:hypothetical protein
MNVTITVAGVEGDLQYQRALGAAQSCAEVDEMPMDKQEFKQWLERNKETNHLLFGRAAVKHTSSPFIYCRSAGAPPVFIGGCDDLIKWIKGKKVAQSASNEDDGILWHLAPGANAEDPSKSSPTLVQTMCVLDQLGDIDTARCVAYVRLQLTMYWSDSRLKEHHTVGEILPESLWAPNPRVKEEIVGEFEVSCLEFVRMVEDDYNGDVYRVVSYGGTITNPMDLHLFPFDYDDIELTFIANSYCLRTGDDTMNAAWKTDYRLTFQSPPAFTYTPVFRVADQFQVQGFSLISVNISYINVTKAQDQVYLQLNVSRNSQYYFYKVLVPLLLIMCLNFGAFALPVDSLNDRLQFAVGLFLSAFALMYVISEDMPKTEYQTPIDMIILVSTLILALTGVHAVGLAFLVPGNAESPCIIDALENLRAHGLNASGLKEKTLSLARFWTWSAECADTVGFLSLVFTYLTYLFVLFLPPYVKHMQWRKDHQQREVLGMTITEISTEGGPGSTEEWKKKVKDDGGRVPLLRLEKTKSHNEQIEKNLYAGAPKWLIGKYQIKADTAITE